jgi:hypothetical protein
MVLKIGSSYQSSSSLVRRLSEWRHSFVLILVGWFKETDEKDDKKKKKKKDAQLEKQSMVLRIYEFSPPEEPKCVVEDLKTQVEGLQVEGLHLRAIFGGPYTALHFTAPEPKNTHDVRFLCCQQLPPVLSPSVAGVPPVLVEWDAQGCFCLMAFHSNACLFTTSGNELRCFARLNYAIRSAFWLGSSVLFFITDRDIRCLLVHAVHLGSQLLASSAVGPWQGRKTDPSPCHFSEHKAEPLLLDGEVPLALRPPGPLSFFGVKNEELLLVDGSYNVHALSLAHPALKFLILAAIGKVSEAMLWAPRVNPTLHNRLAELLSAMGYEEYIADLPAAEPLKKLEACISTGRLGKALELAKHECERVLQHSPTASSQGKEMLQHFLECCLSLGHAALREGDAQTALEIFRLASTLDESFYIFLGAVYIATQRTQELRQLITELCQKQLYGTVRKLASLAPLPSTHYLETLKQSPPISDACTFLGVNGSEEGGLLATWYGCSRALHSLL